MIGATYSFYLLPPTGSGYRRNITGLVQRFHATRVAGARGPCTLTLAPGLDPELFVRDVRLVVRRDMVGQPSRMLFNTIWLLRAPEESFENRSYQHTVEGYDLNDLAYTRRILYKSGTSQAKKTAALDDMIKAIARENMGSSATDTDRSLASYLSIQGDLSQAPSQSKAFAWRWQHEVFQELCQASAQDDTTPTYLTWDIVAASEKTAELQTFVGQRGRDQRATGGRQGGLRFSPERGNIARARYRIDYRDEVTAVTAGGKGKGNRRRTVEKKSNARIGTSPFGRRENFADARQADNTAELTAEAQALLREGRPLEFFEATLQETAGCQFGVDFDFGDYVTVDFKKRTFDVRLDPMAIEIQRQGEEGWTDQLAIVARVEREL